MTAKEEARFTAWRDGDPANAVAFAEAASLREQVRAVVRADRDIGARPPTPPARRPRLTRRSQTRRTLAQSGPGPSRRAILGGSAAAAASVAAAVWGERDLVSPAVAAWTSDYRTDRGKRRTAQPAAGVRLELNTGSSVARIAGRDGVRLVAGEAALNVAQGARPFSMEALGGRLTLADGGVDVRILRRGVCVTCTDGAVEVAHPAGRVRVEQGHQLVYTRDDLGPPAPTDVAMVTAWRRGLLIFRDAPLQTVVDELNRYRPGRILLANPRLARRPVFGVFQIAELDHAVRQVEALTGARATVLPGDWIVLS